MKYTYNRYWSENCGERVKIRFSINSISRFQLFYIIIGTPTHCRTASSVIIIHSYLYYAGNVIDYEIYNQYLICIPVIFIATI